MTTGPADPTEPGERGTGADEPLPAMANQRTAFSLGLDSADSVVEESASGVLRLLAGVLVGGALPFWLLVWGWMYQAAVAAYQAEHAEEIAAAAALKDMIGPDSVSDPHAGAWQMIAFVTAMESLGAATLVLLGVGIPLILGHWALFGERGRPRPSLAAPTFTPGVAVATWDVIDTGDLRGRRARVGSGGSRPWAITLGLSALLWLSAAGVALLGALGEAEWGWVRVFAADDDQIQAAIRTGGPLLHFALALGRAFMRVMVLWEREASPALGVWVGAELLLGWWELAALAYFAVQLPPSHPVFGGYCALMVVAHLTSARALSLASRR